MAEAVKPQGCTNLKLRELARVVTRHYDAYVAPTGLKNSQYSLLSHVVLLGPIRPGELFSAPAAANGFNQPAAKLTQSYATSDGIALKNGDVLIAAITSCTQLN